MMPTRSPRNSSGSPGQPWQLTCEAVMPLSVSWNGISKGAKGSTTIFIQSRPGVSVLGYLLTPKSGKAPHPTIVCVPGYGRGVDDIVGIDDKGQDRPAP